jgi:hypothetical protein
MHLLSLPYARWKFPSAVGLHIKKAIRGDGLVSDYFATSA